MLHHIGIGPYGLVGVLRQQLGIVAVLSQVVGIGISLRGSIDPHIVRTCLPRGTVTLGTANIREELLTTLHIRVVEVTRSRHSQAAMPHHKLIVLLVAHLVLTVVRCTIKQVLVEGLLLTNVITRENLVDTGLDALVSTIGIVRIQRTEG